MRKSSYKTIEAYRAAKRKEYIRYYKSTAIYARRRWEPWEEDALLDLLKVYTVRQLSAKLHRSASSIECKKRRILKQLK